MNGRPKRKDVEHRDKHCKAAFRCAFKFERKWKRRAVPVCTFEGLCNQTVHGYAYVKVKR